MTTTVTYLQDLSFFTYHVLVLLGFGFVLMLHERANGELHRLATLDSLTETYNRRTIEELLRKEEARSRRSGASMGVLMVDIDHFKRINDRHGHHAGDDVLRQFVGTVAQCLRAQDSMGRFGGEEFLVVLPETSLKEAIGVAERLRAAAAAEVYVSKGLVLRLTVSIGIAMLDATAGNRRRLAGDPRGPRALRSEGPRPQPGGGAAGAAAAGYDWLRHSATICSCSGRCSLCEPGAGDAAASRPT